MAANFTDEELISEAKQRIRDNASMAIDDFNNRRQDAGHAHRNYAADWAQIYEALLKMHQPAIPSPPPKRRRRELQLDPVVDHAEED